VVTPVPRLVALDVDGTLLDDQGQLSAQRAAALEALAAVVPTVFATGKTWPSIRDLVARFDLVGPHVICNGAALVTSAGDIEVLAALPDDVADEVAAELRGRGHAVATYLDDGSSVAPAPDPRFAAISAVGEPEPTIAARDDHRVLKLLAVLRPDEEGDLRGLGAGRARIQRTGPAFLEWNAPAASKGAALARLADGFGIDLADVVAVGDSENDVPMLEAAGHGIAVRSSSPAAVRAADEHLHEDVARLLDVLAERVTEGR